MMTSFNKNFGSIKMTPHEKISFTKKKMFYKISPQIWEIVNIPTSPRNHKSTTHVLFIFWQSHLEISHFRHSIDFQNKENIFIVYTHNLRHSESSFGNYSLITFNWSSESRKHFHCLLSNSDQSERIREKYSFVKKYYHKKFIPTIINFIKILFCIYIFL